jgi:HEAT repeat protein
MKNIGIKLAAVALLASLTWSPSAHAGKGGSARAIQAAVDSRSIDAITAEIERVESLACDECIQIITNLTEDSRYAVREVAAWWFAKRGVLRDALAGQFAGDLPQGDTIRVRNAADFLGRTKTYTALPQLRAAIHRGDIGAEAKLALVRAVAYIAHVDGNEVLTTAMTDGDPQVRAAAASAWPEIFDQRGALPVLPLLGDADANVRAQAAGAVGGMREQSARATLESLVLRDPDVAVRRSAAWALGRLGNLASSPALVQATTDRSGLVRGVARAALSRLR